jgi:hypothetical protein
MVAVGYVLVSRFRHGCSRLVAIYWFSGLDMVAVG